MRLELGHKTVIEIEPGKPIMYVGESGNVPLSFRQMAATSLPKIEVSKPAPTFKKIKYAGAED